MGDANFFFARFFHLSHPFPWPRSRSITGSHIDFISQNEEKRMEKNLPRPQKSIVGTVVLPHSEVIYRENKWDGVGTPRSHYFLQNDSIWPASGAGTGPGSRKGRGRDAKFSTFFSLRRERIVDINCGPRWHHLSSFANQIIPGTSPIPGPRELFPGKNSFEGPFFSRFTYLRFQSSD